MTTLRVRRFAALVALSAFALLAAACGSSTTATESAGSSSSDADTESDSDSDSESDTESEAVSEEEAGDGEHGDHDEAEHSERGESDEAAGHEHDHGAMLEVDAASAPTVAIEVVDDPKSGFNVAITTTNFTVSAENASTDHVDGEGHMHLLIDGEKQGRFYNDWIHVDGLEAGEHTIEVELNANTHAPYAVDGERIAAAETVTAPEPAGHSHGGTDTVEIGAVGQERGIMSLSLLDDPRGGWNVEVDWADDFTVSPQNASTGHVDGEGHMHLLIDGVRQGRLYGNWFYVPDQGPGEHTIKVQLSTNDHRDYVLDGEPVAVQVTVGEPGGEPEAPADAVMVMVALADGEVAIDANGSDSDRVEVEQGQNVRLMISSDVAELVHVHGYNLFVELVPGETAILDFVAEAPGLFEVELEESGKFLFELSTK